MLAKIIIAAQFFILWNPKRLTFPNSIKTFGKSNKNIPKNFDFSKGLLKGAGVILPPAFGMPFRGHP